MIALVTLTSFRTSWLDYYVLSDRALSIAAGVAPTERLRQVPHEHRTLLRHIRCAIDNCLRDSQERQPGRQSMGSSYVTVRP
jgi:hypothetical protein